MFDAAGASEFGDAILRVYEALDGAIGTLTGAVPAATVLVVSDHGFGGTGNKAVYLNRWLAQLGLQRRHQRAGSQLSARLKCAALQCVPTHLQAQLFRLQHGRWANWLESRSRFAGIDWTGTRAFSEELNYFPSVWLNLKGREPQGVVERADYRRVRDDICMAAEGLRDPEHGRPVVRRAWRREELYDGRWTEYAPDIILEFNYDVGYSYRCLSSASAQTPEAVRVLGASESTGGKLAGMSGSHRPEGVFLRQRLGARVNGGRRGARQSPIWRRPSCAVCAIDPPAGLDGKALDGVAAVELRHGGFRATAAGFRTSVRRGRGARNKREVNCVGVPGMSADSLRHRIAMVAACPFPSARGSQVLIREVAQALGRTWA